MDTPDTRHSREAGHLGTALERLYRRQTFGIKPGLAPILHLCDRIGNPQDRFAVVHVAGTNDKGSVCAMIESVLRRAGLKTGLYTSPHMVRFNERIRINGQDAADGELSAVIDLCETAADHVRQHTAHEATFFEVATAMAFACFERAGIQVAVIETGMGGRLDATNVVRPMLSVITRIAMDHEAYLGTTIDAVAAEKAGIIKEGRPLVAGPQEPAAEAVLRSTALARRAPYIAATEAASVRRVKFGRQGQIVNVETAGGGSGSLDLPLAGVHQIENLAVALAALEQVFAILEVAVPFQTLRDGIASVRWRGRFEVLRENPTVIADAAHNPSGAAVLAATLKALGLARVALVAGMCSDKDTNGVVRMLAGTAGKVWTVPIPNPRSLPPSTLAESFRRAGVNAQEMDSTGAALREAEAWATANHTAVVVAGSIFLLGEVLPHYPGKTP